MAEQEGTLCDAPEQANGYRYEYDSAQRPIKVHDNGELLAEYAYNGFGERIKKVVYRGDQKKVTYYLYDGHTLTAEIDGDTDTYKQAVFLDDAPVAYLVGKDTFAIHSDHLGTPRMVIDKDGEVVWSADYDPFGEATISADTTLELPYRLPGQYADAETGTHYNYFRDYDPAKGRYITSDPIGLQGGLNTYAYVQNDPLGMADPLGLAMGLPTTEDSPAKPSAGDGSEQAYTEKLKMVLDYAIEDLKNSSSEGKAKALEFLNKMKGDVAAVAVILAGLALVPGAAPVVMAGAWLLAGYTAAKFLYDTVKLLVKLKDTDLCNEAALQDMGKRFAGSIGTLGEELLSNALLGGLGKLGGAVKDAALYAGDGAWTLWKKLKARFNKDVTNGGICSFAGDTLVITDSGYKPIKDIQSEHDRVWVLLFLEQCQLLLPYLKGRHR